MATPSGQISLSQVNTELGFSSTAVITMNDAAVRSLAGVPTGAITMANLQNKSNTFNATISSPQQDLNLITYLTPLGYTPGGAASVIVAPGVYIWSSSTGNAGLTIPSAFGAGNLTLTNNGYIMGQGGNAGPTSPSPGAPGGPAISISTPVTIVNNSFIGGGGGGGGISLGGGGAGGGNGYPAAPTPTSIGGPGGAIGAVGNNGSGVNTQQGGSGGGRIFPGTGGRGASFPGTGPVGTSTGGGAGGGGGMSFAFVPIPPRFLKIVAGGGGGWGAAGGTSFSGGISSAPGNTNAVGGAGGASNAVGGDGLSGPAGISNNAGSGGTGGNAITLNGNSATRSGPGSTWGAVS